MTSEIGARPTAPSTLWEVCLSRKKRYCSASPGAGLRTTRVAVDVMCAPATSNGTATSAAIRIPSG
ncbi:hypothetical protein I551_3539 [Mycobacterium ulcerans str. Harvey]|uniref:Uncharacterized protein n=1 Tax=Mycobacterium ulcerans str. Harvey TaxID=1299332 RepID=A0ABP3AF74_MYCUL|nr:hypothetical protein I551_3539 [Mycobacterium ulcerans str. Harvey]